MALDRQYFGFGVEMVDGGSRVGSGDVTKGPILDHLEPVEQRVGIDGKDDRCRIINDRMHDGLVRLCQTLLLVTE